MNNSVVSTLKRQLRNLRALLADLESSNVDTSIIKSINSQIEEIEQEINTTVISSDLDADKKEIKADSGSTAIEGDITDSIVMSANTIVIAERYSKALFSNRSSIDIQRSTENYLNFILDRYRYLNFKGMGVIDRIPLRLPLLDMYIPLKARLELPDRETWRRSEYTKNLLTTSERTEPKLGKPVPLLNLIKNNSGLIILGDPGSGKTTFLKFLALVMALGKGKDFGLEERLPILVPLSTYSNALQEKDIRLDDFVANHLHDLGINLPIGDILSNALQAGSALVLLDGLDEVKDINLRHTVIERAIDFYTSQYRQGNKFVLTSRIIGYGDVRTSANELIECTIVDFDDDEINNFVARWTLALEKQAQGDTRIAYLESEKERNDLLSAIHHNSGIHHLATNPLLLTILAIMKRQGVSLPERRVQLYDQYIRTLLSTWNRARSLSGRSANPPLDDIQAIKVLAHLAYWMHELNPMSGLVKREDLKRELETIFNLSGNPTPELVAHQFLDDVHEYTGLLLERGPAEFGFIHLTFEEFLSAVAIATKSQGDITTIVNYIVSHLGDQHWHEVLLLTIGYISVIQQLDRVAGKVIETLVENKTYPNGQTVLLAGAAVLEIPEGVPIQSKGKVINSLVSTMQGCELPLDVRKRAGVILGRLRWQPNDLDEFVAVNSTKFLFGEDNVEKEIYYPFWLGKYPVTNIQYGLFIEEDGYKRREFWNNTGWAWLKRDRSEGNPYLKYPDFDNPLNPVVFLNYYEALAYCNWVDNRIKNTGFIANGKECKLPENYIVRLPTEEEWELAARGSDGRIFPWGNNFNYSNANVSENIGEGINTVAVNTFPKGISNTGAWDNTDA